MRTDDTGGSPWESLRVPGDHGTGFDLQIPSGSRFPEACFALGHRQKCADELQLPCHRDEQMRESDTRRSCPERVSRETRPATQRLLATDASPVPLEVATARQSLSPYIRIFLRLPQMHVPAR